MDQLNDIQYNIYRQFRTMNHEPWMFGFKIGRRVFKFQIPLVFDGPNNLTFRFASGSLTSDNLMGIAFSVTYNHGPDTYSLTITRHMLSTGKFEQYKTDDIYFDQLKIADMLSWAEGHWIDPTGEGA